MLQIKQYRLFDEAFKDIKDSLLDPKDKHTFVIDRDSIKSVLEACKDICDDGTLEKLYDEADKAGITPEDMEDTAEEFIWQFESKIDQALSEYSDLDSFGTLKITSKIDGKSVSFTVTLEDDKQGVQAKVTVKLKEEWNKRKTE